MITAPIRATLMEKKVLIKRIIKSNDSIIFTPLITQIGPLYLSCAYILAKASFCSLRTVKPHIKGAIKINVINTAGIEPKCKLVFFCIHGNKKSDEAEIIATRITENIIMLSRKERSTWCQSLTEVRFLVSLPKRLSEFNIFLGNTFSIHL